MAKISTNISIDADVKKQAQELFADLGLDLSTAINIYLKKAIAEQGIPFEITRETPNAATVEAIEEGRRIARDKNVKGYGSVEELKC